jgi:hypothetical protein
VTVAQVRYAIVSAYEWHDVIPFPGGPGSWYCEACRRKFLNRFGFAVCPNDTWWAKRKAGDAK